MISSAIEHLAKTEKMSRFAVFLFAVLVLGMVYGATAQFNFSPNWGKRSGSSLMNDNFGATCEAAQAVKVIAVYHACKVRHCFQRALPNTFQSK